MGALLLLIAGLGLVILEVFIPSGGLIGCLAAIALAVSLVMGFYRGAGTGMAILGAIVLFLPIFIPLAVFYWPRTRMGQRFLLKVPTSEEVLPDDPQRRRLKQLVGQIGRAKSVMLPSGAIEIAGQTVDATSEGMVIEANQLVRVVEVRGMHVVVRPAEDDAPPPPPLHPDLNRPIETLAEDPFEEPLV